jgi:hypothetical protein
MTAELASQIGVIASIATAFGVILAAWQLWMTQIQTKTTFEDTIAREYRELSLQIPTKAFLGDVLSRDEYLGAENDFYHYFDLSNEQVFLRQIGRVRKRTWQFWRDGIRSNLRRPAFSSAWTDIAARSNGDFAELRKLIAEEFRKDPRCWPRKSGRS